MSAAGAEAPVVKASPNVGSAVTAADASTLASAIAESLQLPIATLLQLIPPQLLDPSHERFSSTGLHLPVTSVGSLLETFKAVNWLCANAGAGGTAAPAPPAVADANAEHANGDAESKQAGKQPAAKAEKSDAGRFDLHELVQRAADAVSGQAADRNVNILIDLVEHDGAALRPIGCAVSGNEGAVRFGVMHLLSRVLSIAPYGAKLRVCTRTEPTGADGPEAAETQISCTIEATIVSRDVPIEHVDLGSAGNSACHALLAKAGVQLRSGEPASTPRQPANDASDDSSEGWSVTHSLHATVRSVTGHASATEALSKQRSAPSLQIGREPSMAELEALTRDELRGKKVALRARHDTPFATQVAQLLRACHADVKALPLQDEEGADGGSANAANGGTASAYSPFTAVALTDGRPMLVHYPTDLSVQRAAGIAATPVGEATKGGKSGAAILNPITGEPAQLPAESFSSPSKDAEGPAIEPFAFLLIDDDIRTLQVELLRIRSAIPLLQAALSTSQPHNQGSPPSADAPFPATPTTSASSSPDQSKSSRPTFPFRPRSSPQVQRVLEAEVNVSPRSAARADSSSMPSSEGTTPMQGAGATTIIYFTSLANFRLVRDVVRPIAESVAAGTGTTLPEIIVVPKPAGVRRLLTTLHTALHKPLVDPFFHPIATSPMSPAMLANYNRPSYDFGMASSGSGNTAPPSQEQPYPNLASPLSASPIVPKAPLEPQPALQLPSQSADTTTPAPQVNAIPPSPPTGHASGGLQLTNLPSGAPTMERDRSMTPKATDRTLLNAEAVSNAHGSSAPSSTAGASGASARGTIGGSSSRPTSPMSVDALEYFGEAATRFGDSAARGMVVQSPDGRPAGIYFRPKGSSVRSSSSSVKNAGEDAGATGAAQGGSAPANGSEPGALRRHHSTSARTSASSGEPPSRQAHRSFRAGSTSSASSSSPSISTLLTPQVGIESVLSGSRPPVVGSLPKHLAKIDPQASAAASQSQPHSPSLGPGPDRKREVQEKPSASSLSVNGQSKAAPAPPAPAAQPNAQSTAPPSPLRNVEPKARATKASAHEVTMAPSPSKQKPHKNPLAQARQSFAMIQQPSTGVARPSAQPQAGLLIGAGFSQTTRRGVGPKKAPVREAILPPIKVLIVEDNAINIRILTRFMSRKNIQYEVANNGREAIDKWREGGFHIIFMDIQLPVLDGIQATKEIRRLERHANIGIFPGTPPPGSPGSSVTGSGSKTSGSSTAGGMLSVPGSASISSPSQASTGPFRASVIIVALTASSFNSDRVAALAAGCNDFLNKPVDHKWLEKKIIEWGSMQYILLSGFVSESVTGWRDPASASKPSAAAAAAVAPAAAGAHAAIAAVNSPRDLSHETQTSFDRIPNAQAAALASKLHIAPKKKKASPAASTTSLAPAPSSPATSASASDANPPRPASETEGAPPQTALPSDATVPASPTVTGNAPPQELRADSA